MSATYIAADLRRFIVARAEALCEYCLIAELIENRIEGVTPIGAVTARILAFNDVSRLLERETLRRIGRYPTAAALRRMQS